MDKSCVAGFGVSLGAVKRRSARHAFSVFSGHQVPSGGPTGASAGGCGPSTPAPVWPTAM